MDATTKHDLTVILVGGAIVALIYAQWPQAGGPILLLLGAVIVLGLMKRKQSAPSLSATA